MNTGHVVLRPMEQEDLVFLKELGNDPGVRANVVGWGWPLSLAGQQGWFDSAGSSQDTFRWIVDDSDGNAIGVTGLWDVDWRNGTAMSAIKLGGKSAVRGLGYGSQALKATMAFAFNDAGLNRLYASILASNTASLNLYKRSAGWAEEGRLRQHVRRGGELVDVVQLGILRSEFMAQAASEGTN
jgi:RimJ/RimL family protein N-acetyltransferase